MVPPLHPSIFEEDLRELVALQHATTVHPLVQEEALDELRTLMWFAGDTFGGMEMCDAVALFIKLGFEPVAMVPYSLGEGRHTTCEQLTFFVHGKDGVLMTTDTVADGSCLRQAYVHFNWISHKKDGVPHDWMLCLRGVSASGEMVGGDVWAMWGLASDGLGYRMDKLRVGGKFVWPWVAPPTLKLWHRRDEMEIPHLSPVERVIRVKSRMQVLPNELKKAMAVNQSWF